MLNMKDLDYSSDWTTIKLEDDLLLDDSAFSNKQIELAHKGETIQVKEFPNYGVVKHPIHGLFRY